MGESQSKKNREELVIMDKKIEFQDFIAAVPAENQDFVKELHDKLMDYGCKIEIKTAKSGYMVSYTYKKRQLPIMCLEKRECLYEFTEFM